MGKIAVVGCQMSGKTVFMASLADFYRIGNRADQPCWLIPENEETHKFAERTRRRMRMDGAWPESTQSSELHLYKWSLKRPGGEVAEIEMLDFGGEVFRAAFLEEGDAPQHAEAAKTLVDYLVGAEFLLVLVSLDELFRSDAEDAVLDDDAESQWVTRGFLDFAAKNLPKAGVAIGLTQADKYKAELVDLGGAKGVFAARSPMVASLHPNVPVVAIASVSGTTADGRPADGYSTDGVLSAMKAYLEFKHGSADAALARVESAATAVCRLGAAESPSDFGAAALSHSVALAAFREKFAPVEGLYADALGRNEGFAKECAAFVEAVKPAFADSGAEWPDPGAWANGLHLRFPSFSAPIAALKRALESRNRGLREERERAARRLEAEAKNDELRLRHAEALRIESAAVAERNRLRRERAKIVVKSVFAVSAILLAVAIAAGFGASAWKDAAARREAEKSDAARRAEAQRAERVRVENEALFADTRKGELALEAAAAKNRESELALERINAEKARDELALRIGAERRLAAEAEERAKTAESDAAAAMRAARDAEAEKARTEAKLAESERALCDAKRELEESKSLAKKEGFVAHALAERLSAAVNVGDFTLAGGLVDAIKPLEGRLPPEDMQIFRRGSAACELHGRALAGSSAAQCALAEMYTTAWDNAGLADKWYRVAVDSGNAEAMRELAKRLERGDGGMVGKRSEILALLEGAAERGDAEACYIMGVRHLDGRGGMGRSVERARRMLRRAKEFGYESADLDSKLRYCERKKF